LSEALLLSKIANLRAKEASHKLPHVVGSR